MSSSSQWWLKWASTRSRVFWIPRTAGQPTFSRQRLAHWLWPWALRLLKWWRVTIGKASSTLYLSICATLAQRTSFLGSFSVIPLGWLLQKICHRSHGLSPFSTNQKWSISTRCKQEECSQECSEECSRNLNINNTPSLLSATPVLENAEFVA